MPSSSMALAAGLAVIALAPSLAGQTHVVVLPTLISAPHSPPDVNSEPAIVVSPRNPVEVLVGWQHGPADGSATLVVYRTSQDGLASLIPADPSQISQIPLPAQPGCSIVAQGDVMVASSPQTGDLYIASLACSQHLSVPGPMLDSTTIARKPLGSNTLMDAAQMIPCAKPDKPFLAIGPQPPGGGAAPYSERAYVGYYETDINHLKTARSLYSQPVGTIWALNGEPGSPTDVHSNGVAAERGIGAFPLVLGENSSKPGRLILGYSRGSAHSETPEITASDDGGGATSNDWYQVNASTRLDRYFDPTTSSVFAILGVGMIGSSTDPIPLPGTLMDARTWPSLSEDPRAGRGDSVVAAWTGRIGGDAHHPGDYEHLVLFVAESTDAGSGTGPTFPVGTNVGNARRWALTCDRLDLPDASMWMPSVAVDGLGGINLLFVWTFDVGMCANCPTCSGCNSPRVRVRYVRWPSIEDLASGALPSFIMDVSPEFHAWFPGTGNDYVMLSASGCDVYAAWAQQTFPGQWDIYAAHFGDATCNYNGPH